MRVLVLNCGSSTLKFDVLDAEQGAEPSSVASGSIDSIGPSASARLRSNGGEIERDRGAPDHARALDVAIELLEEAGVLGGIDAVGHRVVHGGTDLVQATRIDEGVIEAIEAVSRLAPLHNDRALGAIRAARERFGPSWPMVACFDTAFFADLPEVAARYAIPRDLADRHGVRRFGFHGLAHQYMTHSYQTLRPAVSEPRLITFQLGSGCSVSAGAGGRPVDTSMGFTPLEGLIMGTRCGDIDPALPLFLMRVEGLSADEVESLLNTRSGLLGLSGRSSDLRELLAAAADGDQACALAVESFSRSLLKYAGAYLALLGGADAIVFGGGIGENSPEVRARVCKGLEWAGLRLDEPRNRDAAPPAPITRDGSAVEAWVIHVDEASVIAGQVLETLAAKQGR